MTNSNTYPFFAIIDTDGPGGWGGIYGVGLTEEDAWADAEKHLSDNSAYFDEDTWTEGLVCDTLQADAQPLPTWEPHDYEYHWIINEA